MERTKIPDRLQGAAIDRVALHTVIQTDNTIMPAMDITVPKYYWRVWLHTIDYEYGTFLELHDDGSIYRVTLRDDEERVLIKPKDA